jgi:hypothetical protein
MIPPHLVFPGHGHSIECRFAAFLRWYAESRIFF